MKTEEIKQLVNDLNILCGEDVTYDKNHSFRDMDDVLYDAMSRPVNTQLLQRILSRNYECDIYTESYNGRDISALEEYRKEGLLKIANETDPLRKIDIFREYAKEISESIKMLDFMDYLKIHLKETKKKDVPPFEE